MRIFVPAMGRINTLNRDGSEVRFAEIAKEWLAKGIQLHIMLPEREKRVLEGQGVKAHYQSLRELIKSESHSFYNILGTYCIRLLQSCFVKYPAGMDLIYVPSDFLIDLIPGVICKMKNRAARLFVCFFLIAPNPFRGYENVYRKSFRLPSVRGLIYFLTQRIAAVLVKKLKGKILVLNSADKRKIVSVGIRNEDVHIVSMGVNVSEYSKTVPEGNGTAYDAVFLGRMHPQKGLFDLVKIWKIVCTKMPGSRLGIIGGGGEEWFDTLKWEINAAGLGENIDILGFKEGEEKIRILKSARCFVMPSHYESWGMVAVEAMASGLPVVAYDLPIFREIFPRGMIRVELGDIKGFAEAVIDLVSSPEYRRKFVEESQVFVKKFDWTSVAEGELQLLAASQ